MLFLPICTSLKPFLDNISTSCYQDARDVVSRQTNLEIARFTEQSLFSLEKTLKFDFFTEKI